MKRIWLTLTALIISLGIGGLVTASAGAAPIDFSATVLKGDACKGLSQLDSTTKDDCSNLDAQGNGVNKIIAAAVNILSIVVGAVAVVMVIIAGLKFVTSGADASKVGSAKGTLTYALVGLAIVALAQLLVHFVLYNASNP